MVFRKCSSLLALAIAGVALARPHAQAPAAPGGNVRVATTHEASFTRMAATRVAPDYPPDAVARGITGVVVVQAAAGPDGSIVSVDVLESPDAALADATRTAVTQWTFPPAGRPYQLRAKLTFYFQVRNGNAVVLTPEQVPGNEDVFGAWDRPSAGPGTPGANRPAAPTVVEAHATDAREIDGAEFARLLGNPATIVLDVRDRDQFAAGRAHDRARNLPADEVGTRSRAELSPDAPIVIDCSRTDTERCRFAYHYLQERRFTDIAIYIP